MADLPLSETDIANKPKPTKAQHFLFMTVLFVVVFISARVAIHQINNTDYINTVRGIQAVLQGQSMYSSDGYIMPPWSAFLLMPLVQQPIETWLALNVALFVTVAVDLGGPAALLLLLHPAFILVIASANPEWLLVGTGLWLLYRAKRGWLRGVAWLLLTCKPQTTFLLLLWDGWQAVRAKDWKAFVVAGIPATILLLLYPQFFQLLQPGLRWSSSTLPTYGIGAALAATGFILLVRRTRLRDMKTLGLLLAPIWAPYMLEYSVIAVAFSLRGAGWVRISLYLLGSIGLAAVFWQDYHSHEAAGVLGMTLLAALLAPAYSDIPESDTVQA